VRYLGDRFVALRERGNGFHTAEFYAAFASELADVRAALDDAFARDDCEAGAVLLGAIGSCWTSLGLDREGIERNETYAEALSGRLPIYAILPGLIALLFKNSRVREAVERAEDALRIARKLGDPDAIATSLQLVASTVQPKESIERLLLESDEIGHRTAEMDVWYGVRRAWLETWTQQFDRADRRLRDLLGSAMHAGDRAFIVNINMRLSVNEYFRGDLAAAVAYACEAENAARSFGNVSALAYQLYVKSNFLCLAGDVASADAAIGEAIEIAASIDPNSHDIAVFIEGAAFVRALDGGAARAALLSGYARAVYARTGVVNAGVRADLRARVEDVLVRELTEDELHAVRRRGALLCAREAIDLALSRDSGGAHAVA